MNFLVQFFTNSSGWDDVYDRPLFAIRPIKEVAKYYETEEELIIEAFREWIDQGYPERLHHPIGLTYTQKKKEPRRIFLEIYNNPEYYYGQGIISLVAEWGKNGKTRGTNHRFTSFSLEPVFSSITHETRREK